MYQTWLMTSDVVDNSVKSQVMFDKIKSREPNVAVVAYPNYLEGIMKTSLNLVNYRLFIERTSSKNVVFDFVE